MVKKVSQIIVLLVCSLFLASFQLSFLDSLSGSFSQINLVFLFLIFTLFLTNLKTTLYFLLAVGFFLDLFSFHFFGFYLLSLGASLILADFILNTLLTDKSLYSFWAITISSTIAYNLIGVLLTFIASGFGRVVGALASGFWQNLFYQLLWNVLGVSLFFYFSVFILKKFKPFLLENKKRL